MNKKFNQFLNEKVDNDTLIEVLIILEEIQKHLNKSVCPMNIISEDPIIYEYGYKFKKGDHYEKVSIDTEGNQIVLKWLDVIDNDWAHYTPNELRFDSVDQVANFLRKRYSDSEGWSLRKRKIGRYLVDDGIDDIPRHMR
jgi:hypothetical protein